MITANIHDVIRAEAAEYPAKDSRPAFAALTVIAAHGTATIFLPAGTAAAVAACINVAVAAGQPAQIEADEVAA